MTENFANDQQFSFHSMTFNIGSESEDGSVDTEIVAQTLERICGKIQAVNWVDTRGQVEPFAGDTIFVAGQKGKD